ncbi:MAG: oxygen-independent coproporphyrinogen-3 oxidase [Bacteroidia bacterium]|jgi:oxygen-independent coproporphyrinogen-3 oxidase
MAGLYVHIPFCRKACHYCDFHFVTSLAKRTEMIDAICKEIIDRKDELKQTPVETIYFGGGTPSVLLAKELNRILDVIHQNYSVLPSIELTFEANPDDCSMNNLTMWKDAGINRLSIGVQSFNQADLDWMNRSHDSLQATQAIDNANNAGFDAINLDLIYGVPSMSTETWHNNVKTALALSIDHISAYGLTVEKGTALHHFIKTEKYPKLKDEKAAEEFEYFHNEILTKGWEQYEISNYCKPGRYARHNTNYWKQKPYLGIGPSAHSYAEGRRRWNIANNTKYIKAINEGNEYFEVETLSRQDRINEHIMLGLRTKWGIDLSETKKLFDYDLVNSNKKAIDTFINKGQMTRNNSKLCLTTTGKLFADYIASTLFVV